MCLAIPMRVMGVSAPSAVVEQGGVSMRISIALTPETVEGDYVLVHAGYALSVIDEVEAKKMIDTLSDLRVSIS